MRKNKKKKSNRNEAKRFLARAFSRPAAGVERGEHADGFTIIFEKVL